MEKIVLPKQDELIQMINPERPLIDEIRTIVSVLSVQQSVELGDE